MEPINSNQMYAFAERVDLTQFKPQQLQRVNINFPSVLHLNRMPYNMFTCSVANSNQVECTEICSQLD